MSKLTFSLFAIVLLAGALLAGCRAEGEVDVDDAATIQAPR